MSAQDIANRLGAAIRTAEAAVAAGNLAAAGDALANVHQAATDGFAFLRDHTKLHLDWDQVAGNTTASTGDFHTLEGGAKDQPA